MRATDAAYRRRFRILDYARRHRPEIAACTDPDFIPCICDDDVQAALDRGYLDEQDGICRHCENDGATVEPCGICRGCRRYERKDV